MELICSAIQAGSRLGYQESAELCAQYLAPILDAIKFNFLPFGTNQLHTAMTLPKQIAYSEPTAAAAAGIQGHHRAGHLVSRHVVLPRQSRTGLDRRARHAGGRGATVHREHADTRNSLAELLGGPDTCRRARRRVRDDARWQPARATERVRPEQSAAAAVVSAAGDRRPARAGLVLGHPWPPSGAAACSGPAPATGGRSLPPRLGAAR